VIKRPYNDPDVTGKTWEIFADVWITDTEGISIKGGEGVGLVTNQDSRCRPASRQ
jgi:Cobalamin biosynthesis protein CbiD